jgi:predicted alpha/beta-fold hydrolase
LQLAQAQALLSSAGAAASNLPAALRGLPVSWPAALRSLPVSWPSLPSLSALPALPLVDPRLLRLPKLRLGALRPRGSATAAADETDVPELTYQPTAFNRAILALTPLLQQPYVPTFWMRSAHAQTILATLLRRRPPVLYNRQILHLSEANHGGCLALDWDSGHWSTTGDIGVIEPYTGPTPERPCLERTEPILFLLPGLTGGSRSRYLCQCIALARQKGWRSVVFNFRGVLIPMSTPRPSTGVDITDVQEAFVHVQACYPRAPVIAMGFSMGANMLVKTLGTWGSGSASTTNGTNDSSDSSSSSSSGSGRDGDIVSPGGGSMRLVGAAAVSCAFDFKKLARNLHKPVNKLLYSRFLTLQLKRQYIRHPAWEHLAPRVAGLDLARALSAQTIWDLDERFTRHLYGIGDVEDYYDRQSSKYLVSHVRTPLLCLNAHDDPFEGEIPLEDIKTNAHILLATTKKGGHVAWSQGANPLAQNSSWMIATTMQCKLFLLTEERARAAVGGRRVCYRCLPPAHSCLLL